MDHIDVPAEQVVPMETIVEGVQGLRITFVNVFSIRHASGGWTLVDAGVPMSESAIRSWAKREFHEGPRAIVLTHGHFDHVSAARGLAEEWNVPIYAHELEFPYLTGQKEYPAPNSGAGGGLMSLLSPIYPRKPLDLGDRLRPLTELEGWEIVHTPGHTPGHVSLFRPSDRTLLAGDAFCTTKPESFFEAAVAQQPELHGPPSYFTSDWEAARRSLQRLAELHPSVVAPGHGKPLSGPAVAPGLAQLALHFNEIAVPENRKVGAVS
jgi:glyoxylase-like metal-dependent hydrolase (beta-lactamase superfamily II)